MNYDIRIKGDEADNGSIEFDKLGNIVKSTKDIAQKALMLKLFGYSGLSIPAYWKDALKIRLEDLSGNINSGTHMLLDADSLLSMAKHVQYDAFRPELIDELQSLTPMALVILTFRSALVEGEERNNLDKPLLKSLLQFKKSFSNDKEVFYFSNRQTIPEVEVRLADFKKIELLDESTPEPHKVVITGRLDEMKYSKSQLVLITDNGRVNVVIKEKNDETLAELKNYFGRDFTIQGMANYRPGGTLSFVEMQGFAEPNEADLYFSRIPSAMSANQQLLFQVKRGGKRNPLLDIVGQWPGDETDAEFEQLLKDVG